MPTREIPTHQLRVLDPERVLRRTEKLIAASLENLAHVPDNLGAAFDDAKALLGLRRALARTDEDAFEALQLIRDLGVALFQRAGVDRRDNVTLRIAGADYEVPGGNSYRNSGPRWGDAVGAAMTLRDEQALERLCAFDTRFWGGSYDEYHDRYAQAIMAYVSGTGDWSERLAVATLLAENAEHFRERGRRLGVPIIALAGAVMAGDKGVFNQQLGDGLTWYRKLFNRKPDNADAGGVIPLRYLGWCARAHDAGFPIEVESDYIPAWMVRGTFPSR